MNTRHLLLLPALLIVVSVPPARAQDDDHAAVQRIEAFRFGGDGAALDDVTRRVAEARSDPARRAAIARDLAAVLASSAPFDAKQFACRQLVFVAGEEQVPALAALLREPQLGHYALRALAAIGGKRVEDALAEAAPGLSGNIRAEALDTLAERGDARALPLLAADLASTNAGAAEDAAFSLAKLPSARSLDLLRQAFGHASGARRHELGDALIALARRDPAAVQSVYALLDADASDPALRAAALRLIVRARGPKALPLLLAALGEDGTPRQRVAAALAREVPGPATTRDLAADLPKLSARGRTLLLEALADRGDPAAAPAVAALCRDSDAGVRLAALQALGAVGDAGSVPELLKAAADTAAAAGDRQAARTSLARLRGREVDAKLLEALGAGEPGARVEAIAAVGARQPAGAVPALLAAARSSDQAVSLAVLRVLRDAATPAQLPDLVAVLLAAPAGERDEAIETVATVARRGADEEQRTGALMTALTSAKPADRPDLLAALGQVGGPRALEAVRKADADPDVAVHGAALRLLAEWPTDEPMPDLLRVVRNSQDATARALALRGYLRMIPLNEQRAPDQALALYRDAASLARGADEKKLLLAGLSKLGSLAALDLARDYLADEAVRPEAELAVIELGRATAGAYPRQTRAALEPLARSAADEAVRKRAADVLAAMDHFGDYVTAWEVSPAYTQAGADYSRLFDTGFPPEDPAQAAAVPWRLMPAGTNPAQPWLLDLLAALGGEQRVAYLRTAVWSDGARDLTLELGSDDGVKAWWNGQVVAAHNVARAVAPGQEKVKVTARPGWNMLLLKVTQNNQGWGAVARFTNPDGSGASGLRFAVPSDPLVREAR